MTPEEVKAKGLQEPPSDKKKDSSVVVATPCIRIYDDDISEWEQDSELDSIDFEKDVSSESSWECDGDSAMGYADHDPLVETEYDGDPAMGYADHDALVEEARVNYELQMSLIQEYFKEEQERLLLEQQDTTSESETDEICGVVCQIVEPLSLNDIGQGVPIGRARDGNQLRVSSGESLPDEFSESTVREVRENLESLVSIPEAYWRSELRKKWCDTSDVVALRKALMLQKSLELDNGSEVFISNNNDVAYQIMMDDDMEKFVDSAIDLPHPKYEEYMNEKMVGTFQEREDV
jgi:hypothetical protein